MKKLLLIVAVAGLTLGATSCQKERECKCKLKNGSGFSYSGTIKKGKLADQQKECEKLSNDLQDCGIDLI